MTDHHSAPLGGAKSVPRKSPLTEIAIKAMKPPERGAITIWDGAQQHFGLRVSSGGAKSFVILVGSGQRQTIGRYPTISLAEARQEAKRLLAEYTLGRRRPGTVRFDDALAEYFADFEARIAQGKNKPRTLVDYRRLINRYFNFGRKPLAEITHVEITRKLPKAPAERDHALVAIKVFLSWVQKPPRRYITHNPCEGMTASKRPARKKLLTDAELAAILATALAQDDPYSRIVALLILTGQRRGEITALQRSWIKPDRTISLPDWLTKNKTSHVFPIGQIAAEILKAIQEEDGSDYLFPASVSHVRGRPTTTFNAWSKSKVEFHARCGVTGWTLHDLRRAFATRLAELRVLPHIIERLLNHKLGSISNGTGSLVSAVAEIYNRATYLPEMRQAIDKFEEHIRLLLNSAQAKIAA
jgi:integrase